MTSGRNRNPAKAERGGIDGRERSAILMTESHRTRRFTVNATEPDHIATMPYVTGGDRCPARKNNSSINQR